MGDEAAMTRRVMRDFFCGARIMVEVKKLLYGRYMPCQLPATILVKMRVMHYLPTWRSRRDIGCAMVARAPRVKSRALFQG